MNRLRVPLAVLILGALAGCQPGPRATMADCIAGFQHPGSDTSRCVRIPGSTAPARPTPLPAQSTGAQTVPAELRTACGHPRSRVSVRGPFTVPRYLCDLTGVHLVYQGVTVTVPSQGNASQIAHADGPDGSTTTTVTARQNAGKISFAVTRVLG